MFGERLIERFLWNFRYVLLLAVSGLLLGSLIFLLVGFLEMLHLAQKFIVQWIDHGPLHLHDIYADMLLTAVVAVDDILLATAMLIFGLGIYDLFISRIDVAEEQSDIRPDWLVFSSLDELKSVLGKVVLMIMIITFLKSVVNVESKEGIDILYMGGGIALIALALKWSHEDGDHGSDISRSTMADRLRDRGAATPKAGDSG